MNSEKHSCQEIEASFSDLVDRRLSAEEEAKLREQIQQCVSCSKSHAQFEKTVLAIRSLREGEAQGILADRVMSRLSHENYETQRRRFHRVSMGVLGSLAAGILVLVMLRRDPSEENLGIREEFRVAQNAEPERSQALGKTQNGYGNEKKVNDGLRESTDAESGEHLAGLDLKQQKLDAPVEADQKLELYAKEEEKPSSLITQEDLRFSRDDSARQMTPRFRETQNRDKDDISKTSGSALGDKLSFAESSARYFVLKVKPEDKKEIIAALMVPVSSPAAIAENTPGVTSKNKSSETTARKAAPTATAPPAPTPPAGADLIRIPVNSEAQWKSIQKKWAKFPQLRWEEVLQESSKMKDSSQFQPFELVLLFYE